MKIITQDTDGLQKVHVVGEYDYGMSTEKFKEQLDAEAKLITKLLIQNTGYAVLKRMVLDIVKSSRKYDESLFYDVLKECHK